MKYGMESEKFIFNLKSLRPSNGVFSFLDALTDFQREAGPDIIRDRVTNEFVLNMVEIGTRPSHSPMEVLKEYLFNYLLIKSVALREQVALVPMGALPMDYLPQMTPKWAYFVQNSILAKKRQDSWTMSSKSPLRAAGNCAGVHVHAEVETPPEFLFSNRELQDKFNMGLMLTPLIAFSSSPYFFGQHEVSCMRGHRYYNGVYQRFSLNGGLPPVMNSSMEVLEYVYESIEHWIKSGKKLGFSSEDLQRLTAKKGANWNPVRWNRQWNTIEIRCLDSDTIDMDSSKFIWISGAMARMDVKDEALQCSVIKTSKKVDKKMIEDCFQVSGGKVRILPTKAIHEIFHRAIKHGTKDKLVEQFLHRLHSFSSEGLGNEYKWVFQILKRALDSHQTTSELLLDRALEKSHLTAKEATHLVSFSIERQDAIIRTIKRFAPEVFQLLEEMEPKFL